MNIRTIHIKQILLVVFVILCSKNDLSSQGTDLSPGKQNHLFIGLNISPSQTSILPSWSSTVEKLNSTKGNSIFGGLEAGYFFSRYFGLSTGIGYSQYTSDLTLDKYNTDYDTTDSDVPSDNYKRYITGSDIKEIQKITFLNIPFAANIIIPFNETFGLYLQAGINVLIPMKKLYSSEGTFTYKGYYPVYNVLISDIPYEGFKTDYSNSDEGSLVIKSLNAELAASGGVSLTFQNKVNISLGVIYNKLISDLSGYTQSNKYRLSSVPDQMRSLMEGSTKTSASSMGLRISLKYYLK